MRCSASQSDFLKQHYKTKEWASSRLARHFGCSRGAVIGKAHRLGLSDTTSGCPRKIKRAAPCKTRTRARAIRATGIKPPRPVSKRHMPLTAPKTVAKKRKAATPGYGCGYITTIKANGCYFPVSGSCGKDFIFCGNRAEPEKPYCAHHAAIAYQPLSSLRQRGKLQRRQLRGQA